MGAGKGSSCPLLCAAEDTEDTLQARRKFFSYSKLFYPKMRAHNPTYFVLRRPKLLLYTMANSIVADLLLSSIKFERMVGVLAGPTTNSAEC